MLYIWRKGSSLSFHSKLGVYYWDAQGMSWWLVSSLLKFLLRQSQRIGEFETLSHNAGEKVEEIIKWIIIDKKTNAENYRSF